MRVSKSIFFAFIVSIMLSTSSLFGMISSRSLISAVKKGDVAAAQVALNRGADVNEKDTFSTTRKTALMLAVEKNNIPMVEFLIEKGANLNARTWLGQTPLIIAAENGLLDMARLLLDKGVALLKASDIPHGIIKGSKVRTALMHAVARGDMPMVKLLLERGADPTIMVGRQDDKEIIGIRVPKQPVDDASLILSKMHGVSALTLAAATGNKPMIELLLGAGEFDEFDKLHAKRIAAERGNFDIVRLFGEGVIDDVYIAAIEADDIDEVKRLLDEGAYVDSRHYKVFQPGALLSAIIKGNPKMVELLFDHKITYRPGYVFEALKRGNLAVAKVMIDRGHGSIFERGLYKIFSRISATKKDMSTLISYAIKKARRQEIASAETKEMRAAAKRTGVSITALAALAAAAYGAKKVKEFYQTNNLHTAAAQGDFNKVRFFLAQGYDVNKYNSGVTPLMLALFRNHWDVARLLLQKGANGGYILIRYAGVGRLPQVRFLLENQVDVNSLDAHRNTPLIAAAKGGHLDVVKLLMKKGADPNLKNSAGKRAYDYAGRYPLVRNELRAPVARILQVGRVQGEKQMEAGKAPDSLLGMLPPELVEKISREAAENPDVTSGERLILESIEDLEAVRQFELQSGGASAAGADSGMSPRMVEDAGAGSAGAAAEGAGAGAGVPYGVAKAQRIKDDEAIERQRIDKEQWRMKLEHEQKRAEPVKDEWDTVKILEKMDALGEHLKLRHSEADGAIVYLSEYGMTREDIRELGAQIVELKRQLEIKKLEMSASEAMGTEGPDRVAMNTLEQRLDRYRTTLISLIDKFKFKGPSMDKVLHSLSGGSSFGSGAGAGAAAGARRFVGKGKDED